MSREVWIQYVALMLRQERPSLDRAVTLHVARSIWSATRILEPGQAVLHFLLIADQMGIDVTADTLQRLQVSAT